MKCHFVTQFVYFLGLFELLSLLFKLFNAFKAHILLLHMFSQFVTLTRVRVTHFTHSLIAVPGFTAVTEPNLQMRRVSCLFSIFSYAFLFFMVAYFCHEIAR